ncbi:phosphopantothenoylcysteine decarboxylase [Endomicrobium proavitum]|uniref:5-phosphopantothenoylcysteine decarboxylase n=1 Tax=Endomicrobium proavitum TaxID=1408281 RepID=A0A0G3WI44_9BACT|nr:phosphopantothenoylcysteine decarboxylase [Endomicrobium proavitum]AKL97555.1 5-phosphopantothenoylcysteine decarboxylase [Endomicrobium proavitum]
MTSSKRLTFLITSGPTKEYLDPVRFISNDSSGKMGAALAEAALKKHHNVIFVTGCASINPPKAARVVNVVSANEMFSAVKKNFKKADVIIGAAAVADFAPAVFSKNKIKKSGKLPVIKLKKNPDIIAYCGKNKKNQIVVSFALETEKLLENAALKLKNKNTDFIVANSKTSICADKSSAHIIFANGLKINLKKSDKKIIAGKIINETIGLFESIKTRKKNS